MQYFYSPKSFRKMLFLLLAFLFLNLSYAQAAIIYVNPLAAGLNNGTSWTNAFTNLQSALAISNSGDQIWVARGRYAPTQQVDIDGSGGSDPQEVVFQIKNGVKLYGGFAGGEASLSARNWEVNRTILSGDIDNNDVNSDGNFIAEEFLDVLGDNAYHVIYTSNVNSETLLDGFIITAGRASQVFPTNINNPNLKGGGWFNRVAAPTHNSSPSIVNTTFRGNYAYSEGGAFYNTPGIAGAKVLSAIRKCKFLNNGAGNSGGAIYIGSFQKGWYRPVFTSCEFNANEAFRFGGAIAAIGDSSIFDSCFFKNNKVTVLSIDDTNPGSGGAFASVATRAIFRSTMFMNNRATGNPTGPFEGGGGGAVYVTTNEIQTNTLGASLPFFNACGFFNNNASGSTAAWGGAVVHKSDGGILKSQYVNCVFSGNVAQDDGGAMANYIRVISVEEDFEPILEIRITNCTFFSNHAGRNGGAIYNNGYSYLGIQRLNAFIENSLFSGNVAEMTGDQIYNTGNTVIAFSLVQGSGGSGAGWNTSIGTDGGNNIDNSPDFIAPADPDGIDDKPGTSDDGLKLSIGSPAVNAGNNGAIGLIGITKDFTGANRIQESKVDIGAYERRAFFIPPIYIYWVINWKPKRPGCLSCPWGIKFFSRILIFEPNQNTSREHNFYWQAPAEFLVYKDSAIVKGVIESEEDASLQFNVYMKLIQSSSWDAWSSKQRTYKATSNEAGPIAFENHQDWTYWELSDESKLVGKEALRGTLKLHHMPKEILTGFQLGLGANDMDGDFGLSGDFGFQGELTYQKNAFNLEGHGSLNGDVTSDEITSLSAVGVSDIYKIYPNPANEFLLLESKESLGPLILKIFNIEGQLLQTTVIESNSGIQRIDLKKYSPGLYQLQILTNEGNIENSMLSIY